MTGSAEHVQLGAGSVLARPVRTRVRKSRGRVLVASPTAGFELDEVGEFIFSKVDGRATIASIGEAVAAEFEGVSAEEATADAIELLGQLVAGGLLHVVPS